MIVCVCNNLNEEKIQEAIDNGSKNFLEVMKYYDCRVECNQCCRHIKEKIEESGN